MVRQRIKSRMSLRRVWSRRALPASYRAWGASGASCGGRWAPEFAVLLGAGLRPGGAFTLDLLEAYRWLHGERELIRQRQAAPVDEGHGGSGPQGNTLAAAALEGPFIAWRHGPSQPWRRHGPLLSLPELSVGGERLDPAALVMTPPPSSPRAARARLRVLLRRGGLDAPASASLLQRYEGYFPSVEVGTAQILHARLGGDLSQLRWLDLRALLWDLIAEAALWALPDRGERGWPAGVHLFTA